MVVAIAGIEVSRFFFQYSLCRVVLMVSSTSTPIATSALLSVLALSSRFDGRNCRREPTHTKYLSVLALSSRFDGPASASWSSRMHQLSVLALSSRFDGRGTLCKCIYQSPLSVLALSSRFDGLGEACAYSSLIVAFSTRSVESF